MKEICNRKAVNRSRDTCTPELPENASTDRLGRRLFLLTDDLFRWSSDRCTAIGMFNARLLSQTTCRQWCPCRFHSENTRLARRTAREGWPFSRAKLGAKPRGGDEEARRWTGLKHRTYTALHWRSEDVPSPAYSGVKRNRRHIELPCITALGAVAHGRVWTIAAMPNTPHTWPTAKLLEEERKGRTRAKLTSEGSRFAACVGSKKTPDVLIHDLLDSGAGRWRRG